MTQSTDVREQVTLQCSQERPIKGVLEHATFASLNFTEPMTFHRLYAMDHVQQIENVKARQRYTEA
jgi:hypothetical protein